MNYEPPALRANIPVVRVARPAVLRITFAFAPRSVSVGYIREGAPPQPLTPGRVILWRPTSSGRFEVQVTATKGSASYVGAVEVGG